MENLKSIKKYALFKNVEDTDITALLRCFSARIVNYHPRQVIVNRGDKIDYLYIVLSGTVQDCIVDANGNVVTNLYYREGDVIGLEYIGSNRKTFSSDLKAIEGTTLLLVDSFRFTNPCQNYCPRHTKVIQNVLGLVSKQNQKLSNRIKELTMHSTKEKVLCYLNNMRAYTKSSKFDIPFNRQELADYLGVERSALSKELSDLAKEGKISYKKNHFEIIKV